MSKESNDNKFGRTNEKSQRKIRPRLLLASTIDTRYTHPNSLFSEYQIGRTRFAHSFARKLQHIAMEFNTTTSINFNKKHFYYNRPDDANRVM